MKGFREQYLECKINGNMITEYCANCGTELKICRKYEGQCRSNKCKHEREEKIDE